MDNLAQKLADILADYRKDEYLNPKKENVLQWVSQFSAENQSTILEEMIHVCKQRYLTENEVDKFLTELVTNEDLTKNDPSFWNNVSLLQIQQNGYSQKIMNEKFKQIINGLTGIDVAINDNSKSHFIHVDDFLYTGNRLKTDLSKWLETAPENSKVDIIYVGYYKNGQYHTEQKLETISKSKNISLTFWYQLEMENNPQCQNVSEVLWPTNEFSTEGIIEEYLKTQGRYRFRDKTQVSNVHCKASIFSNNEKREILEKEFTLAGLKIMNKLNETDRKKWKPLGKSLFPGFGFGAMLFSYRNCPNNAPLAIWWGGWNNNLVWYPLLQRKTYAPTTEEMFGRI